MPQSNQPTTSLSGIPIELRRAAYLSLALAGGAVATMALASYLSRSKAGQRIAVGFNEKSVETWLRETADRLEQGSQILIERLESSGER